MLDSRGGGGGGGRDDGYGGGADHRCRHPALYRLAIESGLGRLRGADRRPRPGPLVTLITVVGILPYIALQLKAVSAGYEALTGGPARPSTWNPVPAITASSPG
ncbi:hypothetical protein VB636_09760, partial [Paracoccus sp. APAP_BH8]